MANNITLDDVGSAIQQLGTTPDKTNAGTVRSFLGRGSLSTIQKHLRALRTPSPTDEVPVPPPPADALGSLWAAAIGAAGIDLARRIEKLTQDLDLAVSRAEQAERDAEIALERQEAAEAAAASACSARDAAESRAAQLQACLAEVREEAGREQQRHAKQIEKLEKRHAQALAAAERRVADQFAVLEKLAECLNATQ